MRRGVMRRDDRVWPLVAVLILVVVVPTATMLWLLAESVQSQSYVVRETLRQAYGRDLNDLARRMDAFWEDRFAATAGAAEGLSPAEAFLALTTEVGWDGVAILGASDEALYPSLDARPRELQGAEDPALAEAERLETSGESVEAARLYGRVIEEATQPDVEAQAWLGRARSLVRIGQATDAVELLAEVFSGTPLALPRFLGTTDPSGRAITPAALFFAINLVQRERVDIDPSPLAHFLERMLNVYTEPVLPSPQRLFLMRGLRETGLGDFEFPTLEAEGVSLSWLESSSSPPEATERLIRQGEVFVCRLPFGDGSVLGLAVLERVNGWIDSEAGKFSFPDGVTVEIASSPLAAAGAFASSEPLRNMEGALALFIRDDNVLGEAENRRVMIHVWSGILVLAATVMLVLAAIRIALRQIRVARLKNDLVATVSHELKTPLSSMRVLVDTLLEGNYRDQRQVREYLELISRENLRLSRLIDNFLAFSRMERNKHAFEFEDVSLREVIRDATEAVAEKLAAPDCHVEVDVSEGLPLVRADRNALVTVLVNLLDNAWKYTGDEKRITIRARIEDNLVSLSVRDNGKGMSRREMRRIFERFYQGNRSLSRQTSGCGLGLAIVRFIVEAHGGTVDVDSRLGEGSVFTVQLPASGGKRSGRA